MTSSLLIECLMKQGARQRGRPLVTYLSILEIMFHLYIYIYIYIYINIIRVSLSSLFNQYILPCMNNVYNE